jgi:glycine/D-amino acid oxidase-like deaminating enzyme
MTSTKKRVAIIGAGIAGLSCAQDLEAHGFAVTLFDKSKGVAIAILAIGKLIMAPSTSRRAIHYSRVKSLSGYKPKLPNHGQVGS